MATAQVIAEKLITCPHPSCKGTGRLSGVGACDCEYKNATKACPVCRVANVAGARYCRGCQSGLAQGAMAARFVSVAAGSVTIAGDFRYPPSAHRGFLWAVDTRGTVWRVSPRSGAKPLSWSDMISPQAGLNRYVAVESRDAEPPYRGGALLACDPSGIRVSSLLTGTTKVLQRPAPGDEIVANATDSDAIGFRGIAANDEFVCFLSRKPGRGEASLMIRSLHPQRPADELLKVPGTVFLTPSLNDGYVGACSEEEVWICGLGDRSQANYALSGFRPFSQRPFQTNLTLGAVPFTVGLSGQGRQAWICGCSDNDVPGILAVNFDRQSSEFRPLEQGSAVSNAHPAGLCVNQISAALFFGLSEAPRARPGALQTGMPVGHWKSCVAYFSRTEVRARHKVTLHAGPSRELSFEDEACTPDSCCGFVFTGDELAIPYFSSGNPGNHRALKVQYWHVAAPG